MVNGLTENEARRVLLENRVDASNPKFFAAERGVNGWVFGWRDDAGVPPVGTHAWVVADNGNCSMVKHGESWVEVLDKLSSGS